LSRFHAGRVGETADFPSMKEEYDVIFSTIQSGMRKAGHPLAGRAAFAGYLVASRDRSYSDSRLSSYTLDFGSDDDGPWAGEGRLPD
jgi:hypothetical protein